METVQENLFDLQVDELSKSYLSETTKWAKFLAILGFIFCGLMCIGGLIAGVALSSSFGELQSGEPWMGGTMGSLGIAFIYLVIGGMYFLPCLYLYRFATNMQQALNAGEPHQLQIGFKNLKSMFRFVGILTIIMLALYILIIIGVGVWAAFAI